jgi:hypothetical protein
VVLTYLDSGVLIAAARVDDPARLSANAVLGDSTRSFASSDFVRLEVLAKATYHKRTAEVDFYNLYFDAVQTWVSTDSALMQLALQRGAEFGLNGMDALHMAAAETAGAEELVTTERPTSPLLRVTSVRVLTIHP